MNFVTYEFIAYTCLVMALYFIFPLKIRCFVLLVASLFFYWTAGWKKLIFLGAATPVTYSCGLAIQALRNPETVQKGEKANGSRDSEPGKDHKEAALAVLLIGFTFLLAMLIYAKVGGRLIQALAWALKGEGITPSVIVPLGISYYTLAAIGYLADVY